MIDNEAPSERALPSVIATVVPLALAAVTEFAGEKEKLAVDSAVFALSAPLNVSVTVPPSTLAVESAGSGAGVSLAAGRAEIAAASLPLESASGFCAGGV